MLHYMDQQSSKFLCNRMISSIWMEVVQCLSGTGIGTMRAIPEVILLAIVIVFIRRAAGNIYVLNIYTLGINI